MLVLLTLTSLVTLTYAYRQHDSILKRQDYNASNYDGHMVPGYTIQVPVDHFNASDSRTYSNRYWVNDTYYQPGGPVFYLDNGEAGISEYLAAQWLAEVTGASAIMALASRYNGMAVLWEHRYYGQSLPVAFNDSASLDYGVTQPIDGPEGWAYLTVDQALEDSAYFARNLQRGGYQRDNMSALEPSNTPWIWIGGSYPGERGAWSRIRNPDVFYAVWASSAVPEIGIDGSDYFYEAGRSFPNNCSNDARAVIAYVDEVLSGDAESQEYIDLQRYMYAADYVGFADINTNSNSYIISDATMYDAYTVAQRLATSLVGLYQSYGPVLTTNIFCDFLESYNPNADGQNTTDPYLNAMTNPGNAQPSPQGILARFGNNITTALQAYIYAYALYQKYTLEFTRNDGASNYSLTPYFLRDQTSWNIQINLELGLFVGSNPDNVSFVSKWDNYTVAHYSIREFTQTPETVDWLPAEPNISAPLVYGGWDMNPTNVMFTAGEHDPWRSRGLFSRLESAPGYEPVTDVPACGIAPSDGTRFGIIYPGAAHVWDLLYDSIYEELGKNDQGQTALESGLELFSKALDIWLPCFANGSGNGNTSGPQPYQGQASVSQISREDIALIAILATGIVMML